MRKIKALFVLMSIAVISTNAISQKLAPTANSGSSKNLEYLTVETFKQKVFDYTKSKTWSYKGKKPCIIDFYADWCRPCKMVGPIIEDLGNDYKGKIFVYKVNVDQDKDVAQAFGIQSIPAVLFVPMTGQPQMMVGYHSKEEFKKGIDEYIFSKK